MNTEQERADFEWWASDEGESPRALERVGECYKLAQIQAYWIAWQARAALQSQDREDAERYRWLRDTVGLDPLYDLGVMGFSALDAYVDHARRIEGEDNG